MSTVIFSKRSKNKGGLTLVPKYDNQHQNHLDHIAKDYMLFFVRRKS